MQGHCSGRPMDAPLMSLEHCIADVSDCCARKRLQLNGDKTTRLLLWFGSTTNLRRLLADTSIRINSCVIQPATVVRDLGVWIDSRAVHA